MRPARRFTRRLSGRYDDTDEALGGKAGTADEGAADFFGRQDFDALSGLTEPPYRMRTCAPISP